MNETRVAKKINSFFCWLCVKGIRKQFCIVCDYVFKNINNMNEDLSNDAAEQGYGSKEYQIDGGNERDMQNAAYLKKRDRLPEELNLKTMEE